MKFTDELRKAIAEADFSTYRLSILSEIDYATISRFMNSKGGLSVDGLDRIAEALDLHITKGRKKNGEHNKKP